MKCLICNGENKEEAIFCKFCGKKLNDVKSERIFCTKCGVEADADSLFCIKCGNPLSDNIQQKVSCTKCGNEIKDGSEFCSKCGNGVNNESPTFEEAHICSKCGSEFYGKKTFCEKCGTVFNYGAENQASNNHAKAADTSKNENDSHVIFPNNSHSQSNDTNLNNQSNSPKAGSGIEIVSFGFTSRYVGESSLVSKGTGTLIFYDDRIVFKKKLNALGGFAVIKDKVVEFKYDSIQSYSEGTHMAVMPAIVLMLKDGQKEKYVMSMGANSDKKKLAFETLKKYVGNS